MHIHVFIERKQEETTVELSEHAVVGVLLEQLKINPETVLVIKDGAVLLPDKPLADKDKIKLLSVVSGG